MKILKIVLSILILSSCVYADDNIRKISVTRKSTINMEAQYAIIYTELKCVEKEMDASYNKMNQVLSTVIDNLKKIGPTDKDITKSVIRQGSEYTWKNNSRIHKGYFSICNLELRINDIQKLYLIYKELSKYDSMTIGWTKYGRNDEFELRNAEFKKALFAAKEKAELMATTLNSKVGCVFSITELSPDNYISLNRYELRAGSSAENSCGGMYGNVEITATVSVEFALK